MARTAILLVFLKYPRAGRGEDAAGRVDRPPACGRPVPRMGHAGPVPAPAASGAGPHRGVLRRGGARGVRPVARLADEWWAQPEGDLGERLRAGFAAAHAAGGPVAAVGTDCLELDAPSVLAALGVLEGHDVVFGPALDGGYYLVGTARAPRLLPGHPLVVAIHLVCPPVPMRRERLVGRPAASPAGHRHGRRLARASPRPGGPRMSSRDRLPRRSRFWS